jgi:hypothetical protein
LKKHAVILGDHLLVTRLALRVACIVLAELSTCLSVLETAMLRWSKAVCSLGWAKVLVVTALLGWVLSGWLSAVALIWGLLTVLALGWLVALLWRIATLLWSVALTIAGLLALVVALLAVLIIWT